MANWLPSMTITHPQRAWWMDASTCFVTDAAMEALPWRAVWDDMARQAAGEAVNVDEGRQVGHTWLRSPNMAPTIGQGRAVGETIEAVKTFADEVRRAEITAPGGGAFTDVVHIGIGGSSLGPMLLVDALQPSKAARTARRGLQIHFVDNTDADGIARLLADLGDRLARTLVIVVSKSGNTVETKNGMFLVRQAMEGRGIAFAPRAVAITVGGSRLDRLSQDEGWLAMFPIWQWVGGRFSITSAVGLLPTELAGVDTSGLIEGAREMDAWTASTDWKNNPAATLAGLWHVIGKGRGERNLVFMPYRDRLHLMSRYLQQLIMESIGKRLDRAGEPILSGLTVYGNKGSTDQHAYVQQLRDGLDDALVTFIQVLDDGEGSTVEVMPGATAGDTLQGFLLGTRRALSSEGRPCLTLTIPTVSPFELGGLIALFERAVGFYASMVNINAYHQPGVEAGKVAANDILALSGRIRDLLSDATARSCAEVATALEADVAEVWSVLEHLVATGRAARSGPVAEGRYQI